MKAIEVTADVDRHQQTTEGVIFFTIRAESKKPLPERSKGGIALFVLLLENTRNDNKS